MLWPGVSLSPEALTEASALLLKVHRSNFALVGFTEEASLEELTRVARPRGLAVVFDAGSGCLLPLAADPALLRFAGGRVSRGQTP